MLKKRIVEAYADGSSITLMANSFDIMEEEILNVLRSYRDECKTSKSFTDEFKIMIAERDMNEDITRVSIANDLQIHSNTIKKSCEQFGQAVKDKSSTDNFYTRIEGTFNQEECPSCKSKRVNEVEEDVAHCMECGNEYMFYEDHVLKVNWEYLEE